MTHAITERLVHTHELDAVARLDLVDEVVIHDHIDAAWQLSWRRPFRHFLNADHLVVAERTQAIFGREPVPTLVCRWIRARSRRACAVHGRVAILTHMETRGRITVMDGPDNFGPHQRAPCDNTFERHHLSEVHTAQHACIHMVVTETPAQPNVELLALDIVFEGVVQLFDEHL